MEEAEVSIVEREDARRRQDLKPFYYGAALIIFVSASFCAAAFVPTVFSRRVYVMDEVVCASSGCQALAKLINSSVNGDLDPCDDFYAYVCGGWRRTHALKPAQQHRNVFDEVEQSVRTKLQDALWKTFLRGPKNQTRAVFAKLASVYVACTKSLTPEGNGVVSMRKLLKHIGLAWPDEDAPYRSNATDLLELLVTLAMKWDVNVLFSFSIKSLSKERGAIVLGLPTPLIPGKLTDAKTSLYQKLIVSLAFLFGRRNEYADLARRLVAVERDIAKLRNHGQTLLTYMVKDLGNLCADFPWQKWMSALNKNLPASAALTAQKSVIVNHPAYIGWLLTYFLGHDYPEDIKAYLALRVLLRYGQATYDVRHVQEIVLRGDKDIPADEVMRTCQQWMAKLLPDTWNSFVSQALAKPADVDRLKQLVSDIKNVFVQRVHRAEWMDSATKNISVLKAKNIAFNVPSFARDAALDKAYSPLLSDARSSGSSFLDLATQLIEAKQKSGVLSMYRVIGLSDSATEHSRANAMYVYSLNVVNVNAALLALPFYAAELPLSVTYGGLGAIVAHEIIHGFDVSGRLYDDVGGFEDWWSNATTAAYRETSACFVDQMRGLASSANAGSVTLEENMADNGGARCAYEAYALAAERAPAVVQLRGLDAFEEEQLFFIAYCYKFCGIERSTAAQRLSTHPAEKLRCNVPLLNMPEFATAFDCEPGAAMNPSRRCAVW
ncbi:hypothetical protein HPB48_012251 [Haemaphysalis longicornis]|uniref:Uncharacterized protein n=1 Tax=Haemaphysalis longicornis TaxID=44386 RepID=A0A9J6G9A9_HAELO|nr:hypothetical protein HPB48_012251 [Haemaphysalis longicornis]